MKSAKLFLFGMYLHLLLSIVAPIGILYLCWEQQRWTAPAVLLLVFYLAMIGVVQILGWICVGSAVAAYRRNRADRLRKGWKLLKLWSIPFYVVNFIYSLFAWFILVGASRGILFVLVPIPIVITCLMIVQSGCVGICYIMYLRKQPENGGKPSGVHYVLQLLSVLDVISTIVILRKFKPENAASPIS